MFVFVNAGLVLSNFMCKQVRNVALGIVSRRINWQQLTMKKAVDKVVLSYCVIDNYIRQRGFVSALSASDFINRIGFGQVMIVRGFRGDSNAHRLHFLLDSSIGIANLIAAVCWISVTSAAPLSEYLLV
ncbi:hypothetical protein Gogos_013655 [Gossypium gossypioides]|uniref:Uncharacterized protein n=1 Tax=Gossypium gossypioides TaxID=34282 RepID=A0A7J9BWA3_GOSGO|nr:hypothetical protein [Gossypium gossypioides]